MENSLNTNINKMPPFCLPPYLKKLIEGCPEMQRQFLPSKLEERDEKNTFLDPLLEEDYTVCKGLIHKYSNRALVLLTMKCAAYCRFCTRRRSVSDIEKRRISAEDLSAMVGYLKKHPEITELVISGGDPLTTPILLKSTLQKFSRLPQIKILRVGTRVPVSNPRLVNKKVIEALETVKNRPLYLMVHFEHPKEITTATICALEKLRPLVTMILSQSVFLRGVNDRLETLEKLFSRLIEIGVKPYYIFRCDYVKGAEHFIVDFEKERKIMTELRKRLSGLAYPMYAIDAPLGSGKIPPPLNFWKFKNKEYEDFSGKKIKNTGL